MQQSQQPDWELSAQINQEIAAATYLSQISQLSVYLVVQSLPFSADRLRALLARCNSSDLLELEKALRDIGQFWRPDWDERSLPLTLAPERLFKLLPFLLAEEPMIATTTEAMTLALVCCDFCSKDGLGGGAQKLLEDKIGQWVSADDEAMWLTSFAELALSRPAYFTREELAHFYSLTTLERLRKIGHLVCTFTKTEGGETKFCAAKLRELIAQNSEDFERYFSVRSEYLEKVMRDGLRITKGWSLLKGLDFSPATCRREAPVFWREFPDLSHRGIADVKNRGTDFDVSLRMMHVDIPEGICGLCYKPEDGNEATQFLRLCGPGSSSCTPVCIDCAGKWVSKVKLNAYFDDEHARCPFCSCLIGEAVAKLLGAQGQPLCALWKHNLAGLSEKKCAKNRYFAYDSGRLEFIASRYGPENDRAAIGKAVSCGVSGSTSSDASRA